ncbi:hypothetical protein H6G74_20390 [Nostoc spongiaeforme FACHB-130]|uniref:Uncharacterized protein n=1 Tax=Nostoc spongiaeforme FACHB-130 TaxID=1357510 RepID=A0ABR8G0C3_9NOSO|nr:hypothetical protein [Nostoc spongiaeforme]MBD2596672.1 hypothetical protein [Nostoc spongiaeforme FACHB-130]
MHRMTNDSHTVIYENGEIKHLECLNPPLEYSSSIDENQREHNEKNRKVKEELIDKGLL